MAEFLTMDEARNEFGSKGKANAGLTLGIIGTALSAMNSGLLGGGGILGLGRGENWGSNLHSYENGATAATAMGAAGLAGVDSSRIWQLERQEANDMEASIWMTKNAELDNLRSQMFFREKDVAEKADIYKAAKADINENAKAIADVKDYATAGIVDLYKVVAKNDKEIYQKVDDNRYESFKNLSDVYIANATANKDLELRVERNREVDQAEKFKLYKDLSDKTNMLAYSTMKQSYDDRIEAAQQNAKLAERISHLETQVAVNSARDPLMFQLAEARTAAALNTKIDGNLTINPNQICCNGWCGCSTGNNIGSIFGGLSMNSGCGCQQQI